MRESKRGGCLVDDQAISEMCADIAMGIPMKVAYASRGIDEATFKRARRIPEIAAKIEQARATAHAQLVRQLDDLIAEGRPTAGAIWRLERQFPSEWKADRQEDTEPQSEPVTPEQARERWLEIGRAMGLSTETLALAAEQWRRDE